MQDSGDNLLCDEKSFCCFQDLNENKKGITSFKTLSLFFNSADTVRTVFLKVPEGALLFTCK
ncbi:MAG: hypothetical protein AYP45_09785 [Candidatus Brocadia carolinensis]|uniref:Uncharacterized protein n=1 Tax=Candidatus Brocadia carolinensis TaxID=1004156 RepID=A0A1V4ATD4_9BACT|nr:MAG: hypothetical protein AYP45_09785 [Candidatus Brocadia caroliniensis]